MKTARRILTVALGALVLGILAPIVYQALSAGQMRGYFENSWRPSSSRSFILIKDDGCYAETPQQGMVELIGPLRREGDAWLLQPRPPEALFSVIPHEYDARCLRIQDGDLYEALAGTTNWTRHARVYNPWRVWLARRRSERAAHISCVNNLKQIGLSFRQWALDNGDQFPFNVGVANGGTRELSARDTDGFERNAACHLLVMSNELNTPKLLVCPKDKRRKPGVSFSGLEAAHVTYRLRSGTNLSDANPQEILMVCPIDGNTLYCDGSVKEGKK
jgi:hypothetical protein